MPSDTPRAVLLRVAEQIITEDRLLAFGSSPAQVADLLDRELGYSRLVEALEKISGSSLSYGADLRMVARNALVRGPATAPKEKPKE